MVIKYYIMSRLIVQLKKIFNVWENTLICSYLKYETTILNGNQSKKH